MGQEKILLTGGTGFVGHHLLRKLLNANQQFPVPIRAIYRSTSDPTIMKSLPSEIEWFEADVLDVVALEDAFEGITHVYHAAAQISFNPSDYKSMRQINIEGTKNMVNQALESGVEKFIHLSSIAAISRPSGKKIVEGDPSKFENLPSEYGKTKYKAEMEIWRSIAEGLNAAIINPALILGPWKWNQSSARLFDRDGFISKVYTNGETGFIDVLDVVDAMYLLMNSEVTAQRFIVAGENLSLRTVFDWMAEDLEIEKPSFESPEWLSAFMWRVLRVMHKLTGSDPLITQETARTAHSQREYSGEKFAEQFQFKYRSIREAVRRTCVIKKSGQRPY